MRKRTKLAAGAGAALAAAGAGGAVAATQFSPSEESAAIVEDAAAQLGVAPDKLDAALRQAFENRIDQAVEDGTLPQQQADAMKRRLEQGNVPLLGVPALGRHEHHSLGPPHGFRDLQAIETYLGVTEAELRQALANGKTLAEIAAAEGKTVDGLVAAIVAETTKKLDQAVADGKLTKAGRNEIVAGLEARTRAFVERARPAGPLRPGFGFGHRGPGPGFVPPGEGSGEKPANDA